MGPRVAFVEAKAASMAGLSVMEAMRVRTLMPGKEVRRELAVLMSVEGVRPRRATEVLPEVAKAWARRGPSPDPPPVMRITLPEVDSSGRVGEMEGYVVVW